MSLKVRRDKNALVIFNKRNGDKMRLAIGKYTKARVPELIDVKITDYCVFACDFCYQGSTPLGQHASLENIKYLIDESADNGVFEWAVGGGEPTDHPNFIEIAKYATDKGLVFNFTTKSLGYVKRNWSAIEPYVGAFAYSAETAQDIESAAKMLKEVPRSRVNLHYVMGLQDRDGFVEFMTKAHEVGFRVTLLGYKTTGRGKDVVPYPYDWWIDAMRMLHYVGKCPTLSIDTPLAEQYDGLMPVDKRAYHTREGFVSAYIDAVAMKMGASSFENLDSLVDFDDNWLTKYKEI